MTFCHNVAVILMFIVIGMLDALLNEFAKGIIFTTGKKILNSIIYSEEARQELLGKPPSLYY